jgi:hypothetical protein
MPQTEVADLVEPARQHVLEESAHELIAAQAAGSRPAGLAFLVLDVDRLVVEPGKRGEGGVRGEDALGAVADPGNDRPMPGERPLFLAGHGDAKPSIAWRFQSLTIV